MISLRSLWLCVIFLFAAAVSAQTVPAPKDVLGFIPGDDRKLASWAQVVDYFKKLDASSDRVTFHEIGKSTMGRPFVYAVITSPENLKNIEKYKNINNELADPRKLGKYRGLPDDRARSHIAAGKTIVLKTFGVHSTEVGSYLSSMLIAHELASSNTPRIQKILDETITLIVPALSPDGVDIVKDWYDKTLGTPHEGTSPPELYHKYVGHDLNRDWYAFTQVESQLTVKHIHNVWHPQIVHDVHQQGTNGARFFVPPYMDPVEPNVPKQIVEGYTELGLYVAGDMRKKGLQGLTTGTTYDAWTPARAYSHYHGGVRILSETASARLASPITVKAEQLRGGRGVDPHKDDANNGPAWKGGEWKMRDITNYMTTAAFSILDHAAANRTNWLTRFHDIGKEAVRPRKDGELRSIVVNDPYPFKGNMEDILRRAGVEMIVHDSFLGAPVEIPLSQPYAAFALAMFSHQKYPNLLTDDGQPISPYDVTSHSLALLQGIEFKEFRTKTDTFKKRNSYDSDEFTMAPPPGMTPYRCKEDLVFGTYKAHIASMDEGWTRWLLESESFIGQGVGMFGRFCKPVHHSISNQELAGEIKISKLRTIIFPDQSPNQILNGYPKGSMPDEYVGGVGKEGVENLKKFVEAGGTLVFLNRSSLFAIEQFNLPIKNVTQGLNRKDFYIPGSILRTNLDTAHPIAKGMPKDSIAWFEDSPVFEITRQETRDTRQENGKTNSPVSEIKIVAKYPSDHKQILLSGWALGQDKIAGKAALVEVTYGKGKIVLFGFRPQYRGQSLATFPLLFNAISQ